MVDICIAGCAVRFELPNAGLAHRVRDRYAGYLRTTPRPLRIRCTVTRDLPAAGETPRVSRDASGAWAARRADFVCRWNLRGGIARIRESIYSFDALLRILLATVAPWRGSLIVHASGLVLDGRGYLFIGRSGSGKTTITRLVDADRVLNDEICAITIRRRGRPMVWGTPFWGELGTGPAAPRSYPLASVMVLKKSSETKRAAESPVRALSSLLGCVCSFSTDTRDAARVLSLAVRMAGHVTSLQFQKKPIPRDFLTDGTPGR